MTNRILAWAQGDQYILAMLLGACAPAVRPDVVEPCESTRPGRQAETIGHLKDVNTLQGVVKSYDPVTRDGLVVTDTVDMTEFELAPNALEGSVFRMLRPGQRVIFDLDGQDRAYGLRLGSEVDMTTPAWQDSEE